MTFSSINFLFFFLPLCVLGFVLCGRFGRNAAVGFLALASFVFYAHWSRTYILLLLGSILFNFLVSVLIDRAKGKESQQTGLLAFGITTNLLALAYFKYLFPLLHFFTQHGVTHHDFGSIILPLGISFFTFTQIAYLIDLKQGVAQRETLVSYLFFVTFFPHLIAGPILHHKEIMPQIREERRYGLNASDVALGLTWFTLGLFKKVMIADSISPTANALFANAAHATATQSWIGVLTYALQLYFDFSGYSDMAVGLARIFSIRFPFNFNSPFKAGSMIDFWQRWHMTLTRYIMDYLYSPIQFKISRYRQDRGKKVSMRAQATFEGFMQMVAFPMLFTMFLAGIWHGAGLQYIAYGVIHGFFLTINHLWRKKVPAGTPLRRLISGPVAIGLTFFCVLMSFVFFRAANLHESFQIYAGMLGLHGLGAGVKKIDVVWIVALLAVVWLMPNTQELLGEQHKDDATSWSLLSPRGWHPSVLWWSATVALFLVSAAYSVRNSTFLYFQF